MAVHKQTNKQTKTISKNTGASTKYIIRKMSIFVNGHKHFLNI